MAEDLRYPIGKFQWSGELTASQRRELIDQIAAAPRGLRAAVEGLAAEQLDTPYRPGGWTVRQVVHHLPDSHLNAYARFRLALTEEAPAVKPYFEDRWAELSDARTAPIDPSLMLLDALHERWVLLLESLTAADFDRGFQHPESGMFSLNKGLGLYAWHGQHHTAQITALRRRLSW